MADIAGFSRLMGRDEEGTTSRVLAFHEQVRAVVESHGGRVVATAGDSVFGDFDSVVAALECAGEIQRALHAANDGLPADERIDARIGLHLGDVIVEDYNVFGDGVNIAARLEQLAEPGGIALSEAVYQQVRGRSDLPFAEAGTRTLKNIDEPIRVYRIGPEAFSAHREGGTPARSEPRGDPGAGGAIRDLVQDALRRRLEEAEAAAESAQAAAPSGEQVVHLRGLPGGPPKGWTALLGPGVLVTAVLGVLLVLAMTTGWTSNGWYPFSGCVLLGLSVGSAVGGATGEKGVRRLSLAAGFAVGGWFLDGTVSRAVMWVVAAALLGTGVQRLIRRRPGGAR